MKKSNIKHLSIFLTVVICTILVPHSFALAVSNNTIVSSFKLNKENLKTIDFSSKEL